MIPSIQRLVEVEQRIRSVTPAVNQIPVIAGRQYGNEQRRPDPIKYAKVPY